MTFVHKKSLGQNFLNSDYVPKQMCDAAKLQAGERVLEIGPGSGALTREILNRGATVLALEADERAIAELQTTFATEINEGQLEVRHYDARNITTSELGLQDGTFKVIANIPYYLSGLLFRKLLATNVQPNTLVFLIQKEVAERIARDPKESLLSLSVKAFGEPHYITTVKRTHFTPPPKVDSAIVAVNNISRHNFAQLAETYFFDLLHLGFGQKRKQLLGNLSAQFERTALEKAFRHCDLPLTVRAEDISLNEWLALATTLHSLPRHPKG
jgi:16S rRNA (adenine1518-N6/adenine1519-N6)-dimethyltransferase